MFPVFWTSILILILTVSGDAQLIIERPDTMMVKVRRPSNHNLSSILPSLLQQDTTADVFLLLDDKIELKAHACFLSASPVLKELILSIDVRVDRRPSISMPGFTRECVECFLQFLYKGVVGRNCTLFFHSITSHVCAVFEKTSVQQEFLKLCAALR